MKSIIQFIALVVLFSSCEKVIELDLSNNVDSLVIEGNITNQAGPYFVKLTKSVNFNEASNYPSVSNAVVIVSDNAGQKDTLSHTSNGIYQTRNLKGIEGRTYTLNVTAEGKTYTAQSTMPSKVNLDTLRLLSFEFGGSTQINVLPVYTDPSVLGNNYRFLQSFNNVLDKTYFTYNDNINNGKPNQRPLRNQDTEIKSGDVIQVEMQCIPLNTYNYYYSLEQQAGNGPGGGTTPANPPNNIVGGAFGLFSAHTSQVKTIKVP